MSASHKFELQHRGQIRCSSVEEHLLSLPPPPGPARAPLAPATGLSCILSVTFHHSWTLGLAAIRAMCPSQSLLTYLNDANRVGRGSMLRKIESGLRK